MSIRGKIFVVEGFPHSKTGKLFVVKLSQLSKNPQKPQMFSHSKVLPYMVTLLRYH